MRVLFVTTSYPRNREDSRGIHVHRLASSLVAKGVDVEVVVPAGTPGGTERIVDGVIVHRVNYWIPRYQRVALGLWGIIPNIRRNPLLALQIPLMMAAMTVAVLRYRRSASIIHAHWVVPSGTIAALAAGNVPLVTTSHGGDVRLATKHKWARLLARWTLRRTAWSLGVSNALVAGLRGIGARESGSRFMPLGVDEALLGDAEPSGSALSWANAAPGMRIVQVGSLTDNKQPNVVLDAMSQLADANTVVRAAMIGDGPLRQSLRDRADQLRLDVSLPGNVAPMQVANWLRVADLLVLPSLAEGRPVVVMEAMACGLPVVASDIPGVRELVDDGKTGFLFDPGDEIALARILRNLADDAAARDRLGLGGRSKLTEEGLLASQVAGDHLALYEATVNRGKQ